MRYVALLRGINVGGHKLMKMDAVRACFEDAGFRDVRTLLASGNVLFESRRAQARLAEKIERNLKSALGVQVGVVLRSIEQLKVLLRKKPFRTVRVTPDVRLFVTFLARPIGRRLAFDDELGIEVIAQSPNELCTVFTLTPKWGRTLLALDKACGRTATTRSWSTVERIVKHDQSTNVSH